ncbi:MAG: ribosome biogenesis GTP-binding protein YihA/YsxC [Prevotellaceae bacterium]|jgi:GTP-binding protein|nr:ribosome biogenesis GTP-binding protein YihA/YsxC [Prevotellaceae bacterium]
MIIKSVSFVCSSAKIEQCPKKRLPEFAFIGRSNVGKSSLINRLTGHGSLAKTSATPGKTQLVNHFIINNNWYLVDLPGYGYAKASKVSRCTFSNLITDYISHREQFTLLFVLIDVRLEPQVIDLEFINKLGEDGIPFALVFTKADKLGAGNLASNVAHYKKVLLESWEELPSVFITSSETGQGREELLKYLENVMDSL